MRRFLLAVMMCGVAAGAQAADLPDLPILRGGLTEGLSKSSVNWQGVYFGGHVARGAADMDFTNSGQDLLGKLLNNLDLESQFNISKWPLLGKAHMQNSGFGGFVGYNFQWSDVIVGVELNYTHGSFFGSSSNSQARSFQYPTDYVSTAVVSSTASMRITDYGSFRVRGGYAFDAFLPYAFVGAAMGQASINRRADANIDYLYVGSAIPALPNYSASGFLADNANSKFITGFAAGLGMEWMVWSGLFMRAEWEYLRFTENVDATVNTVRVGLGYKF